MENTNAEKLIDTDNHSIEIAEDALISEVPDKTVHNDLRLEKKETNKKTFDLIKNANDAVLLEYLSPEITKNEAAKRVHKYLLIALLAIFLVAQFVSVYKITMKVIDYSIASGANQEIIKNLLTFVSAYITSVVIELIAILNYIVTRVFDTSISDLIELFRNSIDKKNKNEQ